MPVIETEIWKKNPDRPGTVIFDSQRAAQDVFNELEAHLKADGRLPDEYLLLDRQWSDGALFPREADINCHVGYGGNEGIYLDVEVRYEKSVYEHHRETGEKGWHKRMVTESFATGKTLGDSNEDLDKMNLVASSVTAALYGSKREMEERYAKIESGEIAPVYLSAEQRTAEVLKSLEKESVITSKTIFGEVRRGDWVIAAANNDYRYLIGIVTEINKHGTPDHGTDNTGDDIHVDFTAFDYPNDRKIEIEEHFCDLSGELVAIDNLSLDDVIMAPDMLISISNLSDDEIARMGNLRANCESFCNCFPQAVSPYNEKHAGFIERINKYFTEYHDSLMALDKRELIGMAARISNWTDVYSLMSVHDFSDEELDYLLLFQNPLEVVSDAWNERINAYDDNSDFLYDFCYERAALTDYPLINNPIAPVLAETQQPPEQAIKQPPADKKPSLMGRLAEADVEAKAYNAQQAQTPGNITKNTKKEIE